MLFSNSSLIFVQWTYVSRKYITLKYQMEIHVCVCMYLCVYVLFCMKRFSKYHNELCKNLLKEKYITESLYWCYSNTHANTMFSEYLILRATFFRERGRGVREGEKHWSEREKSIGCLSYTPWLLTKPTPQAYALTRNRTCDLSVWGKMPNQLRHTSHGWILHI